MVSIIILNWNGKHHMDECLSSILVKAEDIDYELIVVDNGSTDGSQDFIRSRFPSVNLICLDQNYGFCSGNNIGIKAARGEYIVLLNNDTVVDANWLSNLYKLIQSDPAIGLCASKMISYFDKNIIDSAGDGFSVCGAAYKRGHAISAKNFTQNELVFGACAGAAIYRKEMLDKIGLLDEDFFAIYEDADLNFRAQLAGYKCLFAADAIVYHKVNSTLGKMSDFYVYYGQRNVEFAYFKNMPSKLIWKTILQHLSYNFVAFVYFCLKGKGLVFLKAKRDFVKDYRKVIAKRRQIQQTMKVSPEYIYGILDKKWLSTRVKGK